MAADAFMVVVGSAFLATPLALALFIDRQTASFQHQAFGHLRKAARNLRIAAWAVFVYYLGVLAGSWWVNDLQDIFRYPVPAAGVQIYVRLGAAIVGYAFLLLVAREMYKVTLPGQAPAAPARGDPRLLR